MRILIAEDESHFRQLLEMTLAGWGYQVLATRDGSEAWQALQEKDAPQIALLDWMMPGMDGLEVCRKVRQAQGKPYTYLILLTALQQNEQLVAGMEAGADDYLTKPLKNSELRVRLNAGRRMVELQNELLAKNLELDAFNFTIAQELRKPLKILNCYCAMIQQQCGDQLDQRCRGYLQEAHNDSLRMSRLVGTLLNFSRTTQEELHRQPVDLSALAQEVAEELRLMEPQRPVECRIAEGVTAVGDAKLLRVVLDNLLDNAWKFTRGRQQPVIEFGVTEADGRPAYFVRDDGVGFDMTYAHRLFTPFQSLPGTEAHRGSGIGLATVERIVLRHGGRIWAESEPGAGATFYFSLSSRPPG